MSGVAGGRFWHLSWAWPGRYRCKGSRRVVRIAVHGSRSPPLIAPLRSTVSSATTANGPFVPVAPVGCVCGGAPGLANSSAICLFDRASSAPSDDRSVGRNRLRSQATPTPFSLPASSSIVRLGLPPSGSRPPARRSPSPRPRLRRLWFPGHRLGRVDPTTLGGGRRNQGGSWEVSLCPQGPWQFCQTTFKSWRVECVAKRRFWVVREQARA